MDSGNNNNNSSRRFIMDSQQQLVKINVVDNYVSAIYHNSQLKYF